MVDVAQAMPARESAPGRRVDPASVVRPLVSAELTSHAPLCPSPAQAYCLKTDENGVSLYEHLAELLQSIDLKDPNALAEFESKSLDIKAARFKPTVGVKTVAPEIEDLTTKVRTTHCCYYSPRATHHYHSPLPLTTTTHHSPLTAHHWLLRRA